LGPEVAARKFRLIQRWTVGLGWIARATSILTALVNTRLLLGLLGLEGYASLAILLSLGPWLALANLGVPNAVQNLVAQSRASGKVATAMQNTAMSLGLLFTVLLMPVAAALSTPIQDLLLQDHARPGWLPVAAIVWSLMCSGLALIFAQILYANHRATLPALVPALQSALTTVLLMLVPADAPRRVDFVAVAVVLPVLVTFVLLAIASTRTVDRFRLDWSETAAVLKSGRGFLVFASISTVAVSCDYIVMARLLSSAEVSQYNLVSKCFSVVLSLHAVVLSTSWTPTSDLFFQGRLDRLIPYATRILAIGAALMLPACAMLFFGLDQIMALLSGSIVPAVGTATMLSAMSYLAVRIWTDTFAMILMSCGQMHLMNNYVVWQSLLAVCLEWVLGSQFGIIGIFLGASASFLLTASWILPRRVLHLSRAHAP
jgi:O-antigen/teichoic acid export membrane protein